MASKLKGMIIKEISLVDAPASPGADVILAKRKPDGPILFGEVYRPTFGDFYKAGPADEARDDHGRWTSAGGSSGASRLFSAVSGAIARHRTPGGLARQAAATKWASGVGHAVVARAKEAVHYAIGGTGALLKTTKLTHVRPLAGGGLHLRFESKTPQGTTVKSHVEVRSENLTGKVKATVTGVERGLQAYGLQPHARAARAVGGSIEFAGAPGGTWQDRQQEQQRQQQQRQQEQQRQQQPRPSWSSSFSGGPRPSPSSVGAAAAPPLQSQSPAKHVDVLRAETVLGEDRSQTPKERTGLEQLPTPAADAQGYPVPHDEKSGAFWGNSNGHAYNSVEGYYVPRASIDNQKKIEEFWASGGGDLPRMTAEDAQGKEHMWDGGGGDYYVPATTPEKQVKIEDHYATEELRLMAESKRLDAEATRQQEAAAAAERTGRSPDTSRSLFNIADAGHNVEIRRYETPTPEEHARRLIEQFKKRLSGPRLFTKTFDPGEARDDGGRWSAGSGTGSLTGPKTPAAQKAADILGKIKQPVAYAVRNPGAAAGKAANAAAGVAASHFGLPDIESTHVGAAAEHAVQHVVDRVLANPTFRQLCKAVAKAAGFGKHLFAKAGALAPEHDAQLKALIVEAIDRTPLDVRVAHNPAALQAVVQEAYRRLHRAVQGHPAV